MATVLGGGGEQCLAFSQIAGCTNLPEKGECPAKLFIGLGPTPGPDQARGCLQAGERRVGLRLDLVVVVGRPLERSGGKRRGSLEPSSGRLGLGEELYQLRASSECLEDDGQVA